MKEGHKYWAVDKYGLPQQAEYLGHRWSDLGEIFAEIRFDDGTKTDRILRGLCKTKEELCDLMINESLRRMSEPWLSSEGYIEAYGELKKWQKLLEEK